MKLSQTGVGTQATQTLVRDSQGTALLPVQAQGDGATTFRILGKASSDAPFVEIIAPGVADFLQAISWVPYLQLQVTAGTGQVNFWVAEK